MKKLWHKIRKFLKIPTMMFLKVRVLVKGNEKLVNLNLLNIFFPVKPLEIRRCSMTYEKNPYINQAIHKDGLPHVKSQSCLIPAMLRVTINCSHF